MRKVFFWRSKLSNRLPRFKHGYPGDDLSGEWNVRGWNIWGIKFPGNEMSVYLFTPAFGPFFEEIYFPSVFFGLLVYSKTSQNGHPLGNAKLAVLQRWPSYGNFPFMNNRWVNMFGRVSDRTTCLEGFQIGQARNKKQKQNKNKKLKHAQPLNHSTNLNKYNK